MPTDTPVLEVTHLKKYFNQSTSLVDTLLRRRGEKIQAVDDVSFTLYENDSQGIIGESGCGKSTLLLTLMGLYEPTEGQIKFKGRDVAEFDRHEWKEFRSNVQIIFQDPFNSLDPKMTVRETLEEPLSIHGMDDHDERIRDVLSRVELNPPEQYIDRLPKQLSGGEKQRVSIARALIVEPDLILADEPVSMLDVSTQAAILNLLSDLIDDLGVSMLYISHDISTVSYICREVNVMYLGRIVERAPTMDLINDPKHPYSQALIQAIPLPDPHTVRERTTLEGTPRDPIGIGEGCRFRDRCQSIVPPEGLDIEQAAFREAMDFRERIERGDLDEAAVDGPDDWRDAYWGDPDALPEEAQTAFAEAVGFLADDDHEAAVRRLRETFTSVCELTPAYVEPVGDPGRRVACHQYYDHDAYVAEHGEVRPEEAEAGVIE